MELEEPHEQHHSQLFEIDLKCYDCALCIISLSGMLD